MPIVLPQTKNLRSCSTCHATYCINGDQSQYWCEVDLGYPVEGECEFHRANSKYSIYERN